MTEQQTPQAPSTDEDQIIMEPADALQFLGKLIESGSSFLELAVAAKTIKVKKPSKDETEYPPGAP